MDTAEQSLMRLRDVVLSCNGVRWAHVKVRWMHQDHNAEHPCTVILEYGSRRSELTPLDSEGINLAHAVEGLWAAVRKRFRSIK